MTTNTETVHDVFSASPAADAAGFGRLRASVLAQDIALVGGVSLVLGLIRLGAPSFWVDESFTAAEMRYALVDKFVVQLHFLYLLLIQPWAALAGNSEWALRLPSVLGAMLSVGLLVILANKLFDRRVALVSGLLLATSPFFVKWSQQARPYSIFVALSLAAMLLMLRACERNSRGAWALFGLALATVVVWHPVSGFLLLPAYLVFLVQRRDRFLPHGLLAAVVVLALVGPWASLTALRSRNQMEWLDYPTLGRAAHAALDVSGAAGLGLFVACLGLWVLRRTGREHLGVWLGAWALCPFAVGLVVSAVQPIFLDRFLLGAAPAFALLAAVGVMGVRPRLRWIAATAIVLATAVGLAGWYAPKEGSNWRGEDWRGATSAALASAGPGDEIEVVPWWAFRSAEYYGAYSTDVSHANSIWVLNWSETGHGLSRAERAMHDLRDHVLVEEREFGRRLSLQHWVRKPAP